MTLSAANESVTFAVLICWMIGTVAFDQLAEFKSELLFQPKVNGNQTTHPSVVDVQDPLLKWKFWFAGVCVITRSLTAFVFVQKLKPVTTFVTDPY